ncbi:YuzB family protein [Paenibacillus sp. WLX2291]|uniref:YuzB family protein n=1 Tax=Paenibacillus sp. WLX2291 TaxID=3296934 RepID=UPI003984606D
MMRPIIEFCQSNMHNGTDAILKELENHPDYDVVEYGCLGNCGQCYAMPYALVNGEIVSADDADSLYTLIKEKIAEADAWANLDLD